MTIAQPMRRLFRPNAAGLLCAVGLTLLLLSGCARSSPRPAAAEDRSGTSGELDAAGAIRLPAERTAPGRGELRVQVQLPAGYAANLEAPSKIEVRSASGGAVRFPARQSFEGVGLRFPMSFPAEFRTGSGVVGIDLSIVYCREAEQSLCRIQEAHLLVPVTVGPAAKPAASPGSESPPPLLSVTYRVPPPNDPR